MFSDSKTFARTEEMVEPKAMCDLNLNMSHNELLFINESPREKNDNVVYEQVGHKPSCTSTEDG